MPNIGVICEECGETVPSFDIIHYGSIDQGYRKLCSRCFNAEVAKRCGIENFDNISIDPIGIADCSGEEHLFHFRTRLIGDKVVLEAFELRDGALGGYEFKLIGSPEEDLFVLLGRLVQRIRKALSVKYLTDGKYGLQIVDQAVKGVIDCDLSEVERMPLLQIDGREISWEDFGRILMSFEGWQFKLEIVDPSDDV